MGLIGLMFKLMFLPITIAFDLLKFIFTLGGSSRNKARCSERKALERKIRKAQDEREDDMLIMMEVFIDDDL